MNTGVVTTYFTDAVAGRFQSLGLGVQNAVAGPTYSAVLGTQALFNQSDSTQIIFQVVLDNSDLSLIKFGGMGGNTRGTFLTVPFGLTAGIAQDTFVPELRSVETKTTLALQLTRLVRDIAPPRLLYFSLNVGNGILLLTFNEPVVATSLVTTSVTLLSPITGKGSTFEKKHLAISLVNITTLELNVSIKDMNKIKIAIYGLKSDGTNDPLTQLLIKNDAVKDFFGKNFLAYVYFRVCINQVYTYEI
jgi:hypothetical protein